MLNNFLRGFLGLPDLPQNQAVTKSLEMLGDAGGQHVYSLTSDGFARGGRELIAAYHNSPNLRKVVGIISYALAATPFYLIKKSSKRGKTKAWPLQIKACGDSRLRSKAAQLNGEGDKIWDHPFLQFLYTGSPLIPGPQGLKASYAYKEIKGEFFWHLMQGKSDASLPVMWLPIPPQCINSIPSSKDKNYFEVVSGAKTEQLPAEEVFWSKELNLSDIHGRGCGIGDSLKDELDSDEYGAQLLRYTLANKGFKDTLISIKAEAGANPIIAEQLEAKYNSRSRGFYNSGRAMVVDGAVVDVKSLTHDLKELQLLELRKFERDIIYQTFGIPPELFGLVENSNRATIDTAEVVFAKRVLIPRLEAMRLEWQLRLLPLFDKSGEYLLEFVSPVPEDVERRLRVMIRNPSAFSTNEWREEAGYAPRNGEDELPAQPAPTKESSTKIVTSYNKAETGAVLSQQEIAYILESVDSSEVVDKLSSGWQERMNSTAKTAFDTFPGALGSFELVNPLITDHMSAFGGRFITQIDDTTREAIASTLAKGIEKGESIQELAKRISHEMGHLQNGYRSRLIARTETVRSSNMARQFGWQATGLPLEKEYISALVSSTRKSHAALHGKTVPLGGTWTYNAALEPNIADTIQSPGASAHAAHACHCLCTMVAFDPEHAKASIEYNSENHLHTCKTFESEVNSWANWAESVMTPQYRAMESEMLKKLNRME